MTCHKCDLSSFLEANVKIRDHSDGPQVLLLWGMGRRQFGTELAGKAGVGCSGRPPSPTAKKPKSKVTVFLYLLNR